MTRIRLALSFLVVCGAAIAQDLPRAAAVVGSSADGVRFLSPPSVVAMRVQVLSPSGSAIFDSDWKSGNVLDWLAPSPLAYGSYRIVVESKDLGGQLSRKEATLRVEPSAITVDGQGSDSPRITLLAHDGQTGQLVTTSGDLSFRFGDFLNRKDTEAMRLSPEGNLDVKGWIRPGQGIIFADGSVLSTAGASVLRMRPSGGLDDKLHPKSDTGGTGTTNQIAKWVNATDLGDSAISETAGAVTIGSIAAQGQLQIAGSATQDVFAGMGPNIVTGPAFNFGYGGLSFGVGAGFFNVRPAAGATGVNPSLRFMTANQQHMIVTNIGDVGIGTSTPAARLDVVGQQPPSRPGSNTGESAGYVLRVAGAKGGNTESGVGGFGSSILIAAGNGGDSTSGFAGTGGSITLQPGSVGLGQSPIFVSQVFVYGPLRVAPGSNGLAPYLASFSSGGSFEIDAPNVPGGRLEVLSGGNVGIGINTPGEKLHVSGGKVRWANSLLTDDQNGSIELGGTDTIAGSGTPYIDFHWNNTAAEDYNVRLVNDGDHNLHVKGGTLAVDQLAGLGTTPLCQNPLTKQIATCLSSSIRYKDSIANFGRGLDLIQRLRPVTFRWKNSGKPDVGLIAEEVAKVEPLLAVYDDAGKVEGVKYDHLTVALINAVQEQQSRLDEERQQNTLLRARLEKVEEALTKLTKNQTNK